MYDPRMLIVLRDEVTAALESQGLDPSILHHRLGVLLVLRDNRESSGNDIVDRTWLSLISMEINYIRAQMALMN